MSEYGAECIAGMHSLPPIAFSEEFQSEYLSQVHICVALKMRISPSPPFPHGASSLTHTLASSQYFDVFDRLRNLGMLVGEHVWNFADFMTAQAGCS